MIQIIPRTCRKVTRCGIVAAMAAALGFSSAQAAYLIEIDTDGADDGVLTYNSHFAFGGDTTTASQSSPSAAYGLTGGDSIFGGDGVTEPDTYVFTYDPSVDADNLAIPAGTDLGGGILASGLTGGAPDRYSVFATWPFSSNVSGGDTTFTVTTSGDSFIFSFDQSGGGAGTGDEWIKLGEIDWTSGAITLAQEAGANTFVSMRSSAVLFEVVPEPSTFALAALGLIGLATWRFRRV